MSRTATLVGALGLIALGLVGFSFWLSPERIPRSLLILVFCGPLLLPLRGVLRGNVRSHIWLGFLAFAYFAIGIDVAINRIDAERQFGIATTVLSLLMWFGSIGFVRQHSPKKPKR